MAFARMSDGWALGTRDFKVELLQDEKARVAEAELGAAGRRETRELGWERDLGRCLAALRVDPGDASRPPKWADWKGAAAAWMKTRRLASNGWLARRLGMGDSSGVSRSVTDALAGRREEALSLFNHMNSQLNNLPAIAFPLPLSRAIALRRVDQASNLSSARSHELSGTRLLAAQAKASQSPPRVFVLSILRLRTMSNL